ncbi:hypothetical protein RJ639_035699 [Escallonia herrerae]|uniref:CRM domain-containing protein n=1 Tax=Escallonia herrerae TaxID=1293975 RepID=A0AA89BAE6_9ASTE|nr:hypothetical protein RJ639_035699 [Escallonia herrerae]
MFVARKFHKHCFKCLTSLLPNDPSKYCSLLSMNLILVKDVSSPNWVPRNVIEPVLATKDESFSLIKPPNCFGGYRAMSTARGRSMRSKVASRMRIESGKTVREVRRAQKIKKKLMTDEERLIYNLRRAKKKVALLLQKLKKYELPELPTPRHDPELFTPEQLQAYKKIGFRNKNYVPVGVRGVFGGVVQNMHLHWKFHETVQVCCDNFPKEKIKEMATMLARLSGGIVVNVHNVKTIIMFRGRNYRQPKNLIPLNTLTKRKVGNIISFFGIVFLCILVYWNLKWAAQGSVFSLPPSPPPTTPKGIKALFKARFEQALESQKLNIKSYEQKLRRMGVNPDDPVAMASIHRVASTFFNAIDKKEGSPYVFHGDTERVPESTPNLQQPEPDDDSDQEDLDKFIADIEDAADKEWAAEEEAEKEEVNRIRYRNREDVGGRFRRSEMFRTEDSDDEIRGRTRNWKDTRRGHRTSDSDHEDDNGDVSNHEGDAGDSDEAREVYNSPKLGRWKPDKNGNVNKREGPKKNAEAKFKGMMAEEVPQSEDMLSDLEGAMWDSDDNDKETESRNSRVARYDYRSSSDEEEGYDEERAARSVVNNGGGYRRPADVKMDEDLFRDSEIVRGEYEAQEAAGARTSTGETYDHCSNGEDEDCQMNKDDKDCANKSKIKTNKQVDESWDSD